MARIFVIGSAHGDAPELLRDIEDALERLAPDLVILEMPDDAPATGALSWQNAEVRFAYDWAVNHAIPVRGCDPQEFTGVAIFRADLDGERAREIVAEIRRLFPQLTPRRGIELYTKRLPPETPTERRLIALDSELIDPEKAAARTRAIKANVERLARGAHRAVVICGSNHAPVLIQGAHAERVTADTFF